MMTMMPLLFCLECLWQIHWQSWMFGCCGVVLPATTTTIESPNQSWSRLLLYCCCCCCWMMMERRQEKIPGWIRFWRVVVVLHHNQLDQQQIWYHKSWVGLSLLWLLLLDGRVHKLIEWMIEAEYVYEGQIWWRRKDAACPPWSPPCELVFFWPWERGQELFVDQSVFNPNLFNWWLQSKPFDPINHNHCRCRCRCRCALSINYYNNNHLVVVLVVAVVGSSFCINFVVIQSQSLLVDGIDPFCIIVCRYSSKGRHRKGAMMGCFRWQENYHHFLVRIYKTKQPTNQSNHYRFHSFLCSVYHVDYSVFIKTIKTVRRQVWGAREWYKTTIVVGCCCLLCCGGGRDFGWIIGRVVGWKTRKRWLRMKRRFYLQKWSINDISFQNKISILYITFYTIISLFAFCSHILQEQRSITIICITQIRTFVGNIPTPSCIPNADRFYWNQLR